MSEITLPALPVRWRRLALIAGGLAVFFWLRLEDHEVTTAVLMGLIVALLAAAFWLYPPFTRRRWQPGPLAAAGAFAGAGVGALAALSTAFLMLLKNGFHGHLNPDYPVEVMADTLARAPAWALAGSLLGLAAALLVIARKR